MEKVFKYTDYRKYLKDYYEYHKEHTSYFSFRYFSKKAGFSSPSWLKFIISGQRNLSGGAIEKFISALKLGKKEAAYFRALVNFNQAKSEGLKNKYFKELMQAAAGNDFRRVDEKQYEFYNTWYHSAIRELVTLPGFKEDVHWIAGRLMPAIKPSEVKKSLQLLTDLGFIKYNKAGRLVPADPVITTGDEVQSLSVRNFHQQMIQLAAGSLERIPRQKREVSSLTVGISSQCFNNLKARITAFEDELLEMVRQDDQPSEHVYQLNFQLFPLVETGKGKR